MYLRRLRLLFEFEIRKHQKSKDQIISMLLNLTTLNKKNQIDINTNRGNFYENSYVSIRYGSTFKRIKMIGA